MSSYSVNSFKSCRKNHAGAGFSSAMRTNWQNRKTCFALIKYLLSIWATRWWKMLMNNKYKAQTLNENPFRNLHCQMLAWHALNMSCTFDKSAHLIESMCVIKCFHTDDQAQDCIYSIANTQELLMAGAKPSILCSQVIWQCAKFNFLEVGWGWGSLSNLGALSSLLQSWYGNRNHADYGVFLAIDKSW